MSIRARKFKKSIELLNKEATVFIALKDEAMLHRVCSGECLSLSLLAL
jgi:hypothetical protein